MHCIVIHNIAVTNVKSYLSARVQLWIYYVYHRTVRDWHETSPAIKRVVKLSHCLCHITRQHLQLHTQYTHYTVHITPTEYIHNTGVTDAYFLA